MQKQNSRSAFSLLELAIALTIISILISISITAFNTQIKLISFQTTESKIQYIKQALNDYIRNAKNLPCPANPSLASDDPNFGIATAGCALSCPTGLTCTDTVVIGDLPFKSLNLSPEIIRDGFDAKITYAIDRDFARNPSGYCHPAGKLQINDYNGNVLSNTAIFVIVSHGQDHGGAYDSETGITLKSCEQANIDGENCDGDALFVNSDLKYKVDSPANFDDIVGWANNPLREFCPAGLNGCFMWLDSADSCSVKVNSLGEILEWRDKSSVNLQILPSSPSERPSLLYNGPNGLPYMHFSTMNLLINSSLPAIPASNATIVTVFRATSASGLISAIADSPSYFASNLNLSKRLSAGQLAVQILPAVENTSSSTVNDGSLKISVVRSSTMEGLEYFLDFNQYASSTTNVISTGGFDSLLIGGHSNYGYFEGDVLEIIYFNKDLSSLELEILQRYLQNKWGG